MLFCEGSSKVFKKALKAAFEPKLNPYLFYVLKPDGSHYFSITYGEHLRAIKRYR